MEYQSIQLIATYVQWSIAVALLLVTVRIIYIVQSQISSCDISHISFGSIAEKVRKHIKALLIMICITGIIEWIKGYLL